MGRAAKNLIKGMVQTVKKVKSAYDKAWDKSQQTPRVKEFVRRRRAGYGPE